MKTSLVLAAVMSTSAWAAAATYSFTSSNYGTLADFTNCTAGPCANYTPSMQITGSFTVAAPLGPNFPGTTDISSQVTAYSFSDGVNTYTNTDPNARVYQWNVATDASGNISVASILVERWQSGSSPHSIGNRVALVNLNGPSINQADNNLRCTNVGGGTGSGVSDLCVLATTDTASSTASTNSGTWTGPNSAPTSPPPPPSLGPAAAPTLGEWGMISLAVLLAAIASLRLRRQARVPPPAM